MRGRKPKPTAFKVLHGSDQPRNPHEPIPTGDLTACPAHLDDAQRAIWEQAVASSPPGLLKRVDFSVLETWVISVDIQRRALAELAQQDGLGSAAAKRLLTTIGRAGQTVVRCAGELGFSPSSRPRVQVNAGAWRPEAPVRDDGKPHRSIEEYLANAPRFKIAN